MIKQNKKLLILTSIVMLVPIIVGLLLWNRLPDPMPSHWDINGNVDGWSSKAFTVFGIPALLLALHWVCVIASTTDPKSKDYHPKMITLMLWICPVIGLILTTFVYGAALGYNLKIEVIMPLLVGLMLIIVGNLLPKCRQTYTMGIKLPWTFASEENWNATHRFAGKVWVLGGAVIMATSFLGSFLIFFPVTVIMTIAPIVYSYLYYRNHEKEDRNGN